MDQKHNWHANSDAPSANNGDKEIRTWFLTAGVQYMFNHSLGIQLEMPYANRVFKTVSAAPGGSIASEHWSQLGDIRIEGISAVGVSSRTAL